MLFSPEKLLNDSQSDSSSVLSFPNVSLTNYNEPDFYEPDLDGKTVIPETQVSCYKSIVASCYNSNIDIVIIKFAIS